MKYPIHRSPEIQAAMQRTRAAAQQLERDARMVVCWLDAEFPGLIVSLEIQRHYSCGDGELAHVEPRVTDRPRRYEVRDAAEKALKALGWSLNPEGRDVRSDFYRPARSAHARLAAFDRVQRALSA
ncbi:hypothetical protein [Mameliella alba]|uniref:hypothetical protein n=1 Tax=Mameliella alba TaxID=561184 RepID=UPI00142F3E1B|nr:hypothetical protein [Mameliella alba]